MNRNLFAAFGMVLGLGSLSMGCAPATVDGEVGGREFGTIKTAFFDTYTDGDGHTYPVIYLYDYAWTCDEIKEAAASDTDLTTDDPAQVVAGFGLTLYTYGGEFTLLPPDAPGDYTIFELDDFSSYDELTTGDRIALGSVSFASSDGAVDDYFVTENGTVTIDTLELGEKISGDFNIVLDNGSTIEGAFKVTLCDIPEE